MRLKLAVTFLIFFIFSSFNIPAHAIDESAADLVARGRLHLSDLTDAINRKYPKEKENYWDIASIAYHDFTGVPEVDVVVGLEGYHDKGSVYNNGKQVVEDAGAGFGYFNKEKDEWKLRQVELVRGQKYDGFEGADLIGLGKDQLVVYSSQDRDKIATVFMVTMSHLLKKIAEISGKDYGPRVSQDNHQFLIVNFSRALVKDCDACQIYEGQAYRWQNHKFVPEDNEFLDQVEKYSDPGLDNTAKQTGLSWFENYLTANPKDFCALANCYELSRSLGLADEAADYKSKLVKLDMNSQLNLKYCDQWLSDKNQAFQQQYLNELEGKNKNQDNGD